MFSIKKLRLGLQNISKRVINKLSNLKGNRQDIAKGFATGVAVSFTPFVGFHMLISLIVATLLKQNKIAATLGTIFGNPWTFPLIWYLTLHLGVFLLGGRFDMPVNFKEFFDDLYHSIISLDIDMFIRDILPILIPMLIGSIPCFVVAWFATYHLIYKVLKRR